MHAAEDEVSRVHAHIQSAEAIARRADTTHLDAARRAVRALLLEELEAYREARVFPQNPDFDVPMPYFIDASGTRCAMAHLMEIGGAEELVAEIARTRNNAFVAELAEDPRVVAWLEAAGLSEAEAARIQPTYCPSPPNRCVCIESGTPGVQIARITTTETGHLRVVELAGVGEGECPSLRVGDLLAGQYAPGVSSASSLVELRRATPQALDASTDATADADASADAGVTVSDCAAGRVIVTGDKGVDTCSNGLADITLPSPLSAEEARAVRSAPDCADRLAKKGAAWTSAPACDSSGPMLGCNASAHAASGSAVFTTGTILAAVLAYRAARRRM